MRKITIILLAVVAVGLSTSLSAQKQFSAIIKSKVSCEGTTDANFISSLPSENSVMICGNSTKSTIIIQEGFGMITITKGDAKVIYTIYDIAGMGQYYIEINADTLAKVKENNPSKEEIFYTGEKKTIAGYECEKVIFISTDLQTDEETTTVLYVSTEICPGDELNFAEFPGVKGFPLRSEKKIDYQGDEVTIISEAYEVTPSKKIKPIEFLLPSEAKSAYDSPEFLRLFGMGGDDEEE